MPRFHTEWATPRDGGTYHSVTFRPGPNVHEETAACGLVARFWPRVGIRINDRHCEECMQCEIAAHKQGAMSHD